MKIPKLIVRLDAIALVATVASAGLVSASAGSAASQPIIDPDAYCDAWYDGFYGPFNDGCWGDDGLFYYDDGHRNFHGDGGGHFVHAGGGGMQHVRGHMGGGFGGGAHMGGGMGGGHGGGGGGGHR